MWRMTFFSGAPIKNSLVMSPPHPPTRTPLIAHIKRLLFCLFIFSSLIRSLIASSRCRLLPSGLRRLGSLPKQKRNKTIRIKLPIHDYVCRAGSSVGWQSEQWKVTPQSRRLWNVSFEGGSIVCLGKLKYSVEAREVVCGPQQWAWPPSSPLPAKTSGCSCSGSSFLNGRT